MVDMELQRVLRMKGHNVFQSSRNPHKGKSHIWLFLIIILICVYFYYNPSSWDSLLIWIVGLK